MEVVSVSLARLTAALILYRVHPQSTRMVFRAAPGLPGAELGGRGGGGVLIISLSVSPLGQNKI